MAIYDAEEKAGMLFGAIGLLPYFTVAWAVSAWTDGGWVAFGTTLGILFVARAFFSAVEGFTAFLQWRLREREIAVANLLRSLRVNGFPQRYYKHDDFSTYICRVRDDFTVSEAIKWEAKIMETMIAMFENSGILAGARWHAASEAALEAYSPKAQAHAFQEQSDKRERLIQECRALEKGAGLTEAIERALQGHFIPLEGGTSEEFAAFEYDYTRSRTRDAYFSVSDI
jgi:hypothetical protein